MRKIFALLFAVMFLGTTFFGCTSKTPIETLDDGFTEFLDRENLVHSSSQWSMLDRVEQYTYEGKPLKDLVVVTILDSFTGGGSEARGEYFGYASNYEETLFTNEVYCTESFYTQVALDNLTLPYGIDFDDTIADVFEKMGITFDAKKDFVADDEDDPTTMTLYDKDDRLLILHNYLQSDSLVDYSNNFVLKYQETYMAMRDGKTRIKVTRTIQLRFGVDDVLKEISVSVNEKNKK